MCELLAIIQVHFLFVFENETLKN